MDEYFDIRIPKAFVMEILNEYGQYEPMLSPELFEFFSKLVCPNGHTELINTETYPSKYNNNSFWQYRPMPEGYDPNSYFGECSVCGASLWSDRPTSTDTLFREFIDRIAETRTIYVRGYENDPKRY